MPLIVEDGTGLPDADSYVSVTDCEAYATARGMTFSASPADDAEAALRRATAWVDGSFRARFPGRRRNGRGQALEWPRIGAEDQEGNAIADNEIPVEIVQATCEAAIRELAAPGALSPDVVMAQTLKSASVDGAVSVTYAGGGGVDGQRPIATVIDDILSSLIGSRAKSGAAVFGQAARA